MSTAPVITLGLISGTSMDGIDAALVATDGERVTERGPWLTLPYPARLRETLLAIAADPARAEHEPLVKETKAVTEAHAEAVSALLDRAGLTPSAVGLIGFHGQTVLHRPERRFTRQLGDGALLARLTGIDVVNDFRSADVAAGGQGAPFVPLYHAALAEGLDRPLAILNLGGVANVTFLGAEAILAFDTGPASAMIDDWVRTKAGLPYDEDGAIAARGTVDQDRVAQLMAVPFFSVKPPKSLDRNDFPLSVVEGLSLEDGAATLAAFTVASVGASREHLPEEPGRWLVAGGGRHNATLMAGLVKALGRPVEPVESVGWEGDALEAQAFGFLAMRSLQGLPLSLPSTTGVPQPMPGGVLYRPRPD